MATGKSKPAGERWASVKRSRNEGQFGDDGTGGDSDSHEASLNSDGQGAASNPQGKGLQTGASGLPPGRQRVLPTSEDVEANPLQGVADKSNAKRCRDRTQQKPQEDDEDDSTDVMVSEEGGTAPVNNIRKASALSVRPPSGKRELHSLHSLYQDNPDCSLLTRTCGSTGAGERAGSSQQAPQPGRPSQGVKQEVHAYAATDGRDEEDVPAVGPHNSRRPVKGNDERDGQGKDAQLLERKQGGKGPEEVQTATADFTVYKSDTIVFEMEMEQIKDALDRLLAVRKEVAITRELCQRHKDRFVALKAEMRAQNLELAAIKKRKAAARADIGAALAGVKKVTTKKTGQTGLGKKATTTRRGGKTGNKKAPAKAGTVAAAVGQQEGQEDDDPPAS